MKINVKLRNGNIREFETPIQVGDLVVITRPGCQYSSYKIAFEYFGFTIDDVYHVPYNLHGKNPCQPPPGEDRKIWRVCNYVMHSSCANTLICHLKDKDGHNVVIGCDGIKIIRRPKTTVIKKDTIQLMC